MPETKIVTKFVRNSRGQIKQYFVRVIGLVCRIPIIRIKIAKFTTKHQCNVICYHGHLFAQGWDRSGHFHLADGGGLFDEHALDYQRDTYPGPRIKSGFYLLTDNKMIAYEGR
jgi:hypothetical protein